MDMNRFALMDRVVPLKWVAVALLCTLSACVSSVPIPTQYQGDLVLKREGYISPCTQWTSTLQTWFSGPVPVTCLLLATPNSPPHAAGDVVPAGTKVRILSFQEFNGLDAQSKVVQARVFVSGKEIDVYLDSFHLADYF